MTERPQIPYSEIFDTIDGHERISYEDRIQVKAIDLMVDAIIHDEDIEKAFSGHTLGNQSRLTNRRDPNYQKDLLWHVHTPEDFLEAVDREAVSVEIDENGHVTDSGLIQRWGERLSLLAQPIEKDLPDEAQAKTLVRELLERHEEIFELTPAGATVLV